MAVRKEELRQGWDSERRQDRRRMLFACLAAAAVFLVCLGFRYEFPQGMKVFEPAQYYKCLSVRLELFVAGILQGGVWHEREAVLQSVDGAVYATAWYRFLVTLMALAAGAGIAVSGTIFQTIYKNPMASPNMLGATTGVQLGNMLMVMMYSGSAATMVSLRYKYCYGLAALCVVVVVLLGRLAGDRRGNPSVLKMVMAGSVINQGLSTVTMYQMYQMTDEDLLVYQQINMGTYLDLSGLSLALFFLIMGIGLVPMILLRYRFNVTGLDDSEARVSGVNPAPYRLIGQVCGVLLVTAATIHCGQAGMMAMVLPYVVRAAVGADFKKVFTYSALLGGMLMMVCRTLSTSIVLQTPDGRILTDSTGTYPVYLPVTIIVNVCLLPAFVVIMARQRGGFETGD